MNTETKEAFCVSNAKKTEDFDAMERGVILKCSTLKFLPHGLKLLAGKKFHLLVKFSRKQSCKNDLKTETLSIPGVDKDGDDGSELTGPMGFNFSFHLQYTHHLRKIYDILQIRVKKHTRAGAKTIGRANVPMEQLLQRPLYGYVMELYSSKGVKKGEAKGGKKRKDISKKKVDAEDLKMKMGELRIELLQTVLMTANLRREWIKKMKKNRLDWNPDDSSDSEFSEEEGPMMFPYQSPPDEAMVPETLQEVLEQVEEERKSDGEEESPDGDVSRKDAKSVGSKISSIFKKGIQKGLKQFKRKGKGVFDSVGESGGSGAGEFPSPLKPKIGFSKEDEEGLERRLSAICEDLPQVVVLLDSSTSVMHGSGYSQLISTWRSSSKYFKKGVVGVTPSNLKSVLSKLLKAVKARESVKRVKFVLVGLGGFSNSVLNVCISISSKSYDSESFLEKILFYPVALTKNVMKQESIFGFLSERSELYSKLFKSDTFFEAIKSLDVQTLESRIMKYIKGADEIIKVPISQLMVTRLLQKKKEMSDERKTGNSFVPFIGEVIYEMQDFEKEKKTMKDIKVEYFLRDNSGKKSLGKKQCQFHCMKISKFQSKGSSHEQKDREKLFNQMNSFTLKLIQKTNPPQSSSKRENIVEKKGQVLNVIKIHNVRKLILQIRKHQKKNNLYVDGRLLDYPVKHLSVNLFWPSEIKFCVALFSKDDVGELENDLNENESVDEEEDEEDEEETEVESSSEEGE